MTTTTDAPESDETVKLHVTIDINVDELGVDTDVTLVEWNDMTDEERTEVAREIWTDMASHDNGGISVTTPGAKGL